DLVAGARWVFAGPGSPTYALRQWTGSEVPALLADKLDHGGAVVFASAAALTLGRFTVPVYEVYKCGVDPAWADGLDLTSGALGPDVAVIPHFDNAEGGNHDTRYCYLGERRLQALEEQLPAGGWVLGIDEHTGCVLDLDAGTATVVGNGGVTVRHRGSSSRLETGTVLGIAELVGLARGKGSPTPMPVPAAPGAENAGHEGGRDVSPLHSEVRRLEGDFDLAITARDVDGAVGAMLALDDALHAWAGDTLDSDAPDRARAALRRMIARLGELARVGARDPRDLVAPFVDGLLAERASARAERRWADADRARDVLLHAGIEVRDSPEGTTWEIPERPAEANLSEPAPIV
ncbi:MAG: hypothetical protein M0T80_04025, partial [Actinomycetota bacterium]|nr:hypothetical protein [Actinomycetota bacterium]